MQVMLLQMKALGNQVLSLQADKLLQDQKISELQKKVEQTAL